MIVGMAIEVPQTDKQRLAAARLAAALSSAAEAARELSKAFNRGADSLTIQGHSGEEFLEALARQVSRQVPGRLRVGWEERVQALEAQGLTRSDAQAVIDAEDAK